MLLESSTEVGSYTRTGAPPERRDAEVAGEAPRVRSGAAATAIVHVIIIDGDRQLREGSARLLESEGYRVTAFSRADEALAFFERSGGDVVVVDLGVLPIPGMEVLRRTVSLRPKTMVIVTTDDPAVESSLEALRSGAWEYLPKPFSGPHLQVLLGQAAHEIAAERERESRISARQVQHGNSDKLTLLGIAPAFRHVVELARRVAPTNASVIITGESGTGKELIAQFVHRHSRRFREPLVPLNCAAVPEQLLESEMFGHRKGAFTGADREKTGLLEMAHRGTFFLDELTEMPLSLQAKLLRVIQDGVVRRVGSERQDAVVDVRFISATNREPAAAIREHHLREDLYFRLGVVPIELPPLRRRPEDIPILAQHFLEHFWSRHHPPRTPLPHFSDDCIAFLASRHWRGNVRELQNVIEHLVVLTPAGSRIGPDDVPVQPDWSHDMNTTAHSPEARLGAYHIAREQAVASFERSYVTHLLERSAGNMSRAARMGAMNRTTLYRLLERHGFRQEAGGSMRE